MGFVLWWTTEEDCRRIGKPERRGPGTSGRAPPGTVWLDELPWPDYVRREYVARFGRLGERRVWVPREFGIKEPRHTTGKNVPAGAGAIMLRDEDAAAVAFWPGEVRTLEGEHLRGGGLGPRVLQLLRIATRAAADIERGYLRGEIQRQMTLDDLVAAQSALEDEIEAVLRATGVAESTDEVVDEVDAPGTAVAEVTTEPGPYRFSAGMIMMLTQPIPGLLPPAVVLVTTQDPAGGIAIDAKGREWRLDPWRDRGAWRRVVGRSYDELRRRFFAERNEPAVR